MVAWSPSRGSGPPIGWVAMAALLMNVSDEPTSSDAEKALARKPEAKPVLTAEPAATSASPLGKASRA